MTSRELARQMDGGSGITTTTAMQIVAVYAAVRIIAEGVAQIPIHVYRRLPNGGKERAVDYDLYRVLHDSGTPNPWQTAYEFKETVQGHATINGNGYAYISRNPAGRVLELIPIQPSRVTPRQDANLTVSYDIANSAGKIITYPARDIFHLRGLSNDGISGHNPVRLQMAALGLAKAAEAHGSKFFENMARPSGALTTDQKLSGEQMKSIKDSWDGGFSGENAYKTAILDGGFKWLPFTMSNEEAQFLETRKFQIQEIARMFRVPPHMLADLDRATFSNIEEQSLEFVKYTLLPWLKRWEGAINKTLIPESDRREYFAEFLIDGLLRGDFKTRVEGYASMINWGIMSPNEARERENMNPRDGGDAYLQPVNMTSDPTSGRNT